MSDRVYNILFLCTGNSARSVLGEAIVNHLGKDRFKGFSAGSQPKGEVHPYTLDLLAGLRLPTDGLFSKSWDLYAVAGAPQMDFIFTVCDSAAGEACPAWPGQPMTAHWGIPDPAAVEGSGIEKRTAFRQAYAALENRIKLFLSLPLASLDKMTLQNRLNAIGRQAPSSAAA
ncbi:MAG: arsenate reductase ArsC [Alphaproteobacteria bacterium]|jgi:arsenate reductase